MTDLLTLADRVQALTSACRETGNDVLYACGWTSHEMGEGDNRTTIWTSPRGEEFTDGDQPDPTASLDAARIACLAASTKAARPASI